MAASIITDAELLALALGAEALNSIDGTVRTAHAQSASDRVRSAVGRKYASVSVWGDDCKGAAADLAAASLLARRGYNGADDRAAVEARATRAEGWLELVSTGERDPQVTGTRIGGPLVAGRTGGARWRRDAFSDAPSISACTGIDLGDGES